MLRRQTVQYMPLVNVSWARAPGMSPIAAQIKSRHERSIYRCGRLHGTIASRRMRPSMPASHSSPSAESPVDRCPADAIAALDGEAFVAEAYRRLLGRMPNGDERATMLDALLRGEPKSWILGGLRYGAEGRAAAIPVGDAFRRRYLAQRTFRWPVVGPLIERAAALWRLPASLRYFRGMEQRLATARAPAATAPARIDAAIMPPPLGDTLEIVAPSHLPRAREKSRIAPDVPTSSLSRQARYALFEDAFYDSSIVSAKQRVYLPYLDRRLAASLPFLDLGCGRGEFLRILRGEHIASVGVDINPVPLAALRADGFDVQVQDLIAFLEADTRMYAGAASLQVVEHLDAERIERMLALVAPRLVPGAVLIVETPNPLSPFALAQFHTDPTHIAPIPPERMRFFVEAAGFERSRTLFQARVPAGQFFGPDPKAYYMDYAIIAFRSAA
jgi:O-antigen chain-terminating methyltransferase